MLTLATTFFLIVPSPPVEPIDHGRVLACILAVEGNPWPREGGAYGFKRSTWRQHTHLPFRYASIPVHAHEVARKHLAWLVKSLLEDGLTVSPYVLAACWLHGLEGGKLCMEKRWCEYGERVENLYEAGYNL